MGLDEEKIKKRLSQIEIDIDEMNAMIDENLQLNQQEKEKEQEIDAVHNEPSTSEEEVQHPEEPKWEREEVNDEEKELDQVELDEDTNDGEKSHQEDDSAEKLIDNDTPVSEVPLTENEEGKHEVSKENEEKPLDVSETLAQDDNKPAEPIIEQKVVEKEEEQPPQKIEEQTVEKEKPEKPTDSEEWEETEGEASTDDNDEEQEEVEDEEESDTSGSSEYEEVTASSEEEEDEETSEEEEEEEEEEDETDDKKEATPVLINGHMIPEHQENQEPTNSEPTLKHKPNPIPIEDSPSMVTNLKVQELKKKLLDEAAEKSNTTSTPLSTQKNNGDHIPGKLTKVIQNINGNNSTVEKQTVSSPFEPQSKIFLPKKSDSTTSNNNKDVSPTTMRRPTNPFRVVSVGGSDKHSPSTSRNVSMEKPRTPVEWENDSVAKLQKTHEQLILKCTKLQKEINYLTELNHKGSLDLEDGRKLTNALAKLQEYLDRKTKERYEVGVLLSRRLRREINRGENGEFWVGTK
ncbi:hypothetical protein NCAS_0G02010 [Naumovozyma castellii]|uniref:Uncharacterized protein n=1 Tax=Naumovozyma castellii TaxID=27288 RepID=G0VI54_NAUCA|nr:hypothetical protein NCAS_0G02010 [Naumovozyma castellii CBS 4309]CCC71088.1 hypothetical protein NCAS_0G02010 [Naumovozyma castellii CBS 4309]